MEEENLIPETAYQLTNRCDCCGEIIWNGDETNEEGNKHIECSYSLLDYLIDLEKAV